MKTTSLLLNVVAGAVTMAGCGAADPRDNVSAKLETPRYEVTARDGAFEVRQYAPQIVATATVEGDLASASSRGFRMLAGYIFGGNGRNQSVAMTAPVAAVPVTPPGQAGADDAASEARRDGEGWEISFLMPRQHTLTSLPLPNDKRVKLRQRPASCHAATVFTGVATEREMRRRAEALLRWLSDRNLKATGPGVLARYNDPFTLPWNRRNEVLIPVAHRHCGQAG